MVTEFVFGSRPRRPQRTQKPTIALQLLEIKLPMTTCTVSASVNQTADDNLHSLSSRYPSPVDCELLGLYVQKQVAISLSRICEVGG